MLQVISDITLDWNDMRNTIVIAINFCNAKKIICVMMFIISYHNGIKHLSYLLQLVPCNVMFYVISDILAHWYTFVIAIYFWALMFIIVIIM